MRAMHRLSTGGGRLAVIALSFVTCAAAAGSGATAAPVAPTQERSVAAPRPLSGQAAGQVVPGVKPSKSAEIDVRAPSTVGPAQAAVSGVRASGNAQGLPRGEILPPGVVLSKGQLAEQGASLPKGVLGPAE